MRALRLLLTVATFTAIFAGMGVASAVITAAVYKRAVAPVPVTETRSYLGLRSVGLLRSTALSVVLGML